MVPTLQKAIIVQQDGSVALREIAVPKPGPDEILVKIVAAAQNPTDCGWASSMIREMRVFIHPFVVAVYREDRAVRKTRRECLWM